MSTTRPLSKLKAFVFTTLLIAGCAAQPAPEAVPQIEIPQATGPAFEQLQWLLSIAPGEEVTHEDVRAHFTDDMIAAVGGEEGARAVVSSIADEGPLELDHFQSEPLDEVVYSAVTNGTDWYTADIAVDITTNRIQGLNFNLAPGVSPTWSWEAFSETLQNMAPEASFLVAEVTETGCAEIVSLNPDTALGVASAFKLWLLAALAEAVAEGDLSWDDQLAIRDEWRSIPTGTMHGEEVGAEYPISHYATMMISISDNTATDHLLFTLGRERVETMFETAGHHDPSLNTPLLATIDLVALKTLALPEEAEAFRLMTEDERRNYLDNEIEWNQGMALFGANFWTGPRRPDIQWWASTSDLCRVMSHLKDLAATETGQPVFEILSVNPVLDLGDTMWPYIGFKGGSEPGVYNFTWLLKRHDDRWFVFSTSVTDRTAAIELAPLISLLDAAFGLLEGIGGETPP